MSSNHVALPVLGKIHSIFEYVLDEKGKPNGLTSDQISIDVKNPVVTAKFDGTCCYINNG